MSAESLDPLETAPSEVPTPQSALAVLTSAREALHTGAFRTTHNYLAALSDSVIAAGRESWEYDNQFERYSQATARKVPVHKIPSRLAYLLMRDTRNYNGKPIYCWALVALFALLGAAIGMAPLDYSPFPYLKHLPTVMYLIAVLFGIEWAVYSLISATPPRRELSRLRKEGFDLANQPASHGYIQALDEALAPLPVEDAYRLVATIEDPKLGGDTAINALGQHVDNGIEACIVQVVRLLPGQ